MKTTTKIAASALAMVAVSAGVAGVTTYTMMKPQQDKMTSFSGEFNNTSNARYAAFDPARMQPVDLTSAAESSLSSVVRIVAIAHSKVQTIQGQPDIFDFFFGDGRGRQQQIQTPEQKGVGSGVIISNDGYIATNNHVIDGADELTVKLHDGRELKGRVIGADPTTDLALVKIEGDDFPAMPIGDSDKLKVGEWVLAVGNPFNLGSTVTAGIVSAKARGLGANGVESFIQTDAAVNPGNSGGALVNKEGQLVGVNTAIISQTGSYAGYSFAVPSNIVKRITDDLMSYGTVHRAMLGISMAPVNEEIAKNLKLSSVNGVYIADVVKGSAAENAGLKVGDVLVEIGNVKITGSASVQEAVNSFHPGEKTAVKVIRDGSELSFDVVFK